MSRKEDEAAAKTAAGRYLDENRDFLERYIVERLRIDEVERLLARMAATRKKKKVSDHRARRAMLQDLTETLQQDPSETVVLGKLGSCIRSAVAADEYKVYMVVNNEMHECVRDELVATQDELVMFVWANKDSVRTSLDKNGYALCLPIIKSNGEFAGVLKLRRIEKNGPFHEDDEEVASSYLVWGSIAVHYTQLYQHMNQQRRLNEFLLNVVKSIFQDMVSMDPLVHKIMNFAQELVEADRASLFLVDTKSSELHATLSDVGNDVPRKSQEIRFPIGIGIAGHVAKTGEILNIADAYSDHRFNRNVDQITGYKTHSILCMPIYKEKNIIIGVVQMVNKVSGVFTKEDEEAFKTFAVYCGLALQHVQLYDTIQRSEQKYKVALEVLSYHNSCSDEEVAKAMEKLSDVEPDIDNYYFNPFAVDDFEKARSAVYMFTELFGLKRFDEKSLFTFTLTVRKNYRRVPYHNWTHGFSVANTMYVILKNSGSVFDNIERLAMYIAALCHDLDHRGKNNKFMLETESPLAYIYSTSTMEHHHFNQTVTILQQEGHNIFSKLSDVEYKQVLQLLKHCILATDLALYFENKSKLDSLIDTGRFSLKEPEHRMLLHAMAMTGSDLSANAKPWDIQVKTVEVIFEEFYDQGDAEKAAGRKPIAMMDREQPNEQPASQVGFLTGICSPCYSVLYKFIPKTKALLDMCKQNLEKWKEIDKNPENYVPLGTVKKY